METLSAINNEQTRIVRAGLNYLLAYIWVISAVYILVDVWWAQDVSYFLTNLLSVLAGYWLLIKLMQKAKYLPNERRGGFGTYFVVSIITFILIAAGLLLLIIPGIYLTLRLLPVLPIAIVNGPGTSLRVAESWRVTASSQGGLAVASLGPISVLAAGFAVYLLSDWSNDAVFYTSVVIGNTLLSIGFAWLTVLSLAAFGLVYQPWLEVEN